MHINDWGELLVDTDTGRAMYVDEDAGDAFMYLPEEGVMDIEGFSLDGLDFDDEIGRWYPGKLITKATVAPFKAIAKASGNKRAQKAVSTFEKVAHAGGSMPFTPTRSTKDLVKTAASSRAGRKVLGRSALGRKILSAAGVRPSTRVTKPSTTMAARIAASPTATAAVQGDAGAKAAIAAIRPELDDVLGYLRKAALQRQATYEHVNLRARENFRRKVLKDLAHRAKCGDQKAARTVRVIFGRR